MQERIRALRKALGLTQSEFGARLGLKGNTVTGYESGTRKPSDAVLSSICREFHTSLKWLQSGEGEMFPQQSAEEALAEMMGKVAFGQETGFQRRLLLALARLDPEEWAVLEKIAKELAQSK